MESLNSRETLPSEASLQKKKWTDGLVFVIAMWLLSRLAIVVAIQLIAPLLNSSPPDYAVGSLGFLPNFVPKIGWELFSHWDGAWYRQIAIFGYDYADDGQKHSIAFFPLFPLVTRVVMTLGLPFEVAGTLVNNLALLGALLLLYAWAQERYGVKEAKWATAVLALCPFSLYGTVIYTEGLFLLLTTAALRAFDRRQHIWAALLGAMATATRSTGIALVPAFVLVAWRERRPAIAYAASLAAASGLLLFSMYCAIRFGDFLAFVHAQKGWSQMHPSLLGIFTNLFGPDGKQNLIRIVMLYGGSYLLWHLRNKLPLVAVAYGFCTLGLILASGALVSINRFVYGIVSLSLALGLLFSYHPRWGYSIMGLFAVLLVVFSLKFAWWYWVA